VCLKVVNIHAASGKFAEFLLLFKSNVASGTLKEELEDVYLELPTDTLNRVYAGQCQHASFYHRYLVPWSDACRHVLVVVICVQSQSPKIIPFSCILDHNIWHSGVILSEIKDFWRVALAISILYYYPEAENALSQQDRLKEKYMEVEHFITDLGKVN
jgi:hypothetical protein